MKEDNPKAKENRPKSSKFSDQNQPPKKSWGSNLVKGLAGERKGKVQTTVVPTTKKSKPFHTNNSCSNNKVIKRGLIGDLSCSVAATQVHPHALQSQNGTPKSLGSRDLFVEIETLRGLLKESKEKEFQLQAELSESKRNQRVFELEREVEEKKNEVQGLTERVHLLESEKTTLKKELLSLNSDSGRHENEIVVKNQKPQTLEMEVLELRRLNKELQLQKRDLTCRVTSMESQLANLAKASEIKADVETQGEFVNSLIREVNNAVYRDIEDVVAFVKWLDDELCFLVDERAVLKHFDWPEKKADTLREAAFGYKDLKKLESEVIYYHDDPRLPCDIALKKMVSLSEKIERTIYNLLRTRESLIRNCKEFRIPTDWMLDSGIITKVKLGSVKLAKKYMNRVAYELQSRSSLDKDPAMEYMLLQGVRFAFRIHQFAGGFDAETMHAFEVLRKLAHVLYKR